MKGSYQVGDQVHALTLERTPEGFYALVNGRRYEVQIMRQGSGSLRLDVDGRPAEVHWAADGPLIWVAFEGKTFVFDKRGAAAGRSGAGTGDENVLRAPMPGQVRAVEVSVGDRVEQGQTLILLEAMKMEIRIQAPSPGEVIAVLVEDSQQVGREHRLIELKYA